MPQSSERRVIGHAIGGKVCERARKIGTSRCTSARRRRNVVRHAISPTMLATIIVLFVDVTGGGDHPSSSSEDTVETLRRPAKTQVLDNVGGPSVEIRTGEENVQHEQVETAAQISDNADSEFLQDVKQSNWLSACLSRILLRDKPVDFVDMLSTYDDVFRAAHGDLVDWVRKLSALAQRRRRRRRSLRSIRGCRCRRRAETFPGGGSRTPASVHTHLRRDPSLITDDHRGALVEMHSEYVENVNISQYCKPMPVVERMRERPGNAYHNPKFTIVHKCNCGRVCENASHRCVAVRSKNVTRLFELVLFSPAGEELEKRFINETFVEDLECNCMEPIDATTRVSSTTSTPSVSRSLTFSTSPTESTTVQRYYRCPEPFANKPVCKCPKRNQTCKDIVRGKQRLDSLQLTCVRDRECYGVICTNRRTPSLNMTSGYCEARRRRSRNRRRHERRRRARANRGV